MMYVIERKGYWLYVGGIDDKGKIIEVGDIKSAIIFDEEKKAKLLFEYIKSIDSDYCLSKVTTQEMEEEND